MTTIIFDSVETIEKWSFEQDLKMVLRIGYIKIYFIKAGFKVPE